MGFINLNTGEIDRLTEGETFTVPTCSPEEARALREKGLVRFHTHPKILSGKPSLFDVVASHLSGGPEYVITPHGFYEVRPKNLLPLEEIKRRTDGIDDVINQTWQDFKTKPTIQKILTILGQNIPYLLDQEIPQEFDLIGISHRYMGFVFLDIISEKLKPLILRDILPTEITFIEW